MWFESRQKKKNRLHKEQCQPPPVQTVSPPPPYAARPVAVSSQSIRPAPSHVQLPQYISPPLPYRQPQNAVTSLTLPANTPYPIVNQTVDSYNRTLGLYDACADKFCSVIARIDEDDFVGGYRDLAIDQPSLPQLDLEGPPATSDRRLVQFEKPPAKNARDKTVEVFSKLDYYLNSQLPLSLPPLQLYMPTYPLLCLAAEYSADAYLSPRSSGEKRHYVSADGRTGAKAMVVKSVPCDDKKTIVFAIRGTSALSLRDWGVNLKNAPSSPQGFLDDEGNLCHTGFLKVARAMVRPIAARLRQILEENPDRTSCSLLITGHSAGGAVASLLYAHMLSTSIHSELNTLTDCFKRVHCVTFGAPPISLLPLQKPTTADGRLRKCLFHSFMNEGDPVVRAEPAYIRSLIDLLAAPNPITTGPTSCHKTNTALTSLGVLGASMSRLDLSLKPTKSRPNLRQRQDLRQKLWWDVPPATLSNAGRLVALRVAKNDGRPESESIGAFVVRDEELRKVVFGDPIMHQMSVYRRRIEALAFRAVTGKLCS
ncbi:uncharacterized protein HMPREF1541_05963 [Cyphellophora europaea CBS 101466]|uniref:Fungal lipase-type domain-containing protein n=1 Tax=Cyphellophora europaea (strain CBS 101466) TaxID=1220924 RepID=W2RTF7_CYPE1|nr:uncharacterized protein HMPREF1541_05963 [Cyphellophora europaea CBS 101466]ETN39737.1 hypothetical protein HMPREF1541_05963 [Cyphellophora europaea CBS 101466]